MKNSIYMLRLCVIFIVVAFSSNDPVFAGLGGAFYVFTGRYTTESMGGSANPFTADYEDNYVLGAAYSRDVWDLGLNFVGGWEAGLAGRFADKISGEVWGGLRLSHQGFILFRQVRFSPGLVFGLSLIDKPIGEERRRESSPERDASLLFYLGPELAFTWIQSPRWELVYRLHHRSGGNETLGNLMEGYNANTLGLRYNF